MKKTNRLDNEIDGSDALADVNFVPVLNDLARTGLIPEKILWFWVYLSSHTAKYRNYTLSNELIKESQYSLNNDESIRLRFEDLMRFHLGEIQYFPSLKKRKIKLHSASYALSMMKDYGPLSNEEIKRIKEKGKSTPRKVGVLNRAPQEKLGCYSESTPRKVGVAPQEKLGSSRRLEENTILLKKTILFSNEKREDEKTREIPLSPSPPFSDEKEKRQKKLLELEQDKMNRIWNTYLPETQQILEAEGYDSLKVKKYLEREIQARIDRINVKTGKNRTNYLDKTYSYYKNDWQDIIEKYIDKYPSRDWYPCVGCDSKVKNKGSLCKSCQNQLKEESETPQPKIGGLSGEEREERETKEIEESAKRQLIFAQKNLQECFIQWERTKKAPMDTPPDMHKSFLELAERNYLKAYDRLKEMIPDFNEFKSLVREIQKEILEFES